MAEARKADRQQHVVLGRVSGIYGVKGWVRLFSYTAPAEGILDYDNCLLGSGESWQVARIVEGRRQGKGLVARFDGVDDRDAAAGLVDREIAVAREALPEPGEGSYYWADLEGLEVRGLDGTVFGHVDYLIETGANDVLVVRGETETLIPFVTGSVIKNVDIAAGVIVVDWEWE